MESASFPDLDSSQKLNHKFREVLETNEEETRRWESYKQENETAIANLEDFLQKLTVKVMVPVGRKAFIPGHLVHTNEVFVQHYENYLSKCSSHKAKEICQHRLKMAETHLQKLQREAELIRNNLEKPQAVGAFPMAEQREIIEEYDEEVEKRWREKHKLLLKQSKLREKEEREKAEKKNKDTVKDQSDEEIFKMLSMEELDNELSNLGVEVSEENFKQFMAGNNSVPDANSTKKDKHLVNKDEIDKRELDGVLKKTDTNSQITELPAANNSKPKPDILLNSSDDDVDNKDDDDDDDDEEDDDEEDDDDHNNNNAYDDADLYDPEVVTIKTQADFLEISHQIDFYEYHIQIMEQKKLKTRLPEEILRLTSAVFQLKELQEGCEDLLDDDIDIIFAEEDPTEVQKPRSRRITFAAVNQTIEFNKYQEVSQMIPSAEMNSKTKAHKRDIIKLDDPIIEKTDRVQPTTMTQEERRQLILERVENNLKYHTDKVNQQDPDVVNTILKDSVDKLDTLQSRLQHSSQTIDVPATVSTMQIRFKHSAQSSSDNNPANNGDNSELNVPGTPADFYEYYLKAQKANDSPVVLVNGYEKHESVKDPINRDGNRKPFIKEPCEEAAETELCAVDEDTKIEVNSVKVKPILRNKSAVNSEKHLLTDNKIDNRTQDKHKNKQDKTERRNDDGIKNLNGQSIVLSDIVEKNIITEPEPLPVGKYSDTIAPKKRISHFSRVRAEAKK